jgi:DNA-binding transcriptional LysR family regulator
LVVVMRPEHPLAKKRSVRFKDLLPFPMVTVQPASAIERLLHEHAAEMGAHMRVCVAVNSFDSGCRMVEAGFGISVKPRMAMEVYAARKRLVHRPLEEDWAGNEQRVYALRSTPRLRAVQALIEGLHG